MIKLIKKIVILVIVFFLHSCKKNESTNPTNENNKRNLGQTYHEKYFEEIRMKTNKIEITQYKICDSIIRDSSNILKLDKIVFQNDIEKFDLLFKSIKSGGYCCCPKTHYKIDLYQSDKILKQYNVDTIEVKGKALIYDTSYQTSYIIPLISWNTFIKNSR